MTFELISDLHAEALQGGRRGGMRLASRRTRQYSSAANYGRNNSSDYAVARRNSSAVSGGNTQSNLGMILLSQSV
ncbi:MAG: hypothetical protein ISQ53_01710 [Synechococcus sp. BS307-5m-G39]|nr:hypothetical protein [Synechococcus sp. BS307-5m-G39]MBL6800373.1 hypothetical protein [Synechococcus sp. BS307-5m-G37]